MNRRIATPRRGVSLTELLLLMSSYTMILSMCAVLLHRVMRVEIDSRSHVGVERTSERLSRQFRHDVHHATAAKADATKLKNDAFLQLQIPNNQTIEYRRVNGNVLRTVSLGGKIVAREEFAFEPSSKLTIHEDKSPTRIVLTITSPAVESTTEKLEQLQAYRAVSVGLHAEASLSRDVVLTSSIVGQEPSR